LRIVFIEMAGTCLNRT